VTVVALVDDHRLFTSALAVALEYEGFEVAVPALVPAGELRARLVDLTPSVVVLDLDLASAGNGDCLVAPLAIAGASVLIVSAIDDEARIGRCLELGAIGWLPKTTDLDDLVAAVEAAAEGRSVLLAEERSRLVLLWHQSQPEGATPSGLEQLTRREANVLAQLMQGRAVAQIAVSSWVSEPTVRTQVRSILSKLNVRSQLQAVAVASRNGWVPPSLRNGDVQRPHHATRVYG